MKIYKRLNLDLATACLSSEKGDLTKGNSHKHMDSFLWLDSLRCNVTPLDLTGINVKMGFLKVGIPHDAHDPDFMVKSC